MHLTPIQRTDLLLMSLLSAVPVSVFMLVWAHYAVNIPHWDDALKWFLLAPEDETDVNGKFYQFFKQCITLKQRNTL